jgi:hypothetical protein
MTRQVLLKLSREKNSSKRVKLDVRNTIQIGHFRRVDELIVLQHVIRRFKLHHEADFCKLLELRKELGDILRTVFPKNSQSIFFEDLYVQSLWCCMSFLDSRKNLQEIEQNGVKWVLPVLREDLKNIFSTSNLMHVDCLDLTSLAKILTKFGADIADINRRLNYTRFFSLLGLTSYVSGCQLYTHYINAKFDRHKNKHDIIDSMIDNEALWMFSPESINDDDFSVLLKTPSGAPLRTSKNIQIFGGKQHSISINNIQLKNRLVFSVPTNETPDRIDDALREFRAALMQEYINNCDGYFNVSTDDHSNSIFMTQFVHEACLIKDWDQVQKSITGLWSWDISNQKDNSVIFACMQVAKKIKENKTRLQHDLPIYLPGTIQSHYVLVNKLIGPRISNKPLKPTKIDRFITRSENILGAIDDLTV